MGAMAFAVAAARAAVKGRILNHTCRIRPNVEVVNATKGHLQTWPAVTVTVACQVQAQQPSMSQGETVDNAMLPKTRAVTLPVGTTVQSPYHIEWVEGGVTVEVIGEVLQAGTHGLVIVANGVEV